MQSIVLKRTKLNKNEYEITTKIFNPNPKKHMTLTDVKDLTKLIKTKGDSTFDYFDLALIRVLNGANWCTYNSMDKYLDYYEGKVKDTGKFTNKIFELNVTTYQSIAKK